jgi:NitT/TauT family transport system ATP-binding protein
MTLGSVENLVLDRPSQRGPLRVLDGLDMSFQEGEILAIIGPSGCGKTTLLHILAGLLSPTKGSVDCQAKSALVFQRPTLLPWSSVIDNALYGLRCRGAISSEQRAVASQLLKQMRLGAHVDDYPHQLSEGMKQRVNLVRALLMEPELLLMDEPFSALDALTRRQLQDDLIDSQNKRGFNVVIVSHSLEEVAYLADRVLVLTKKPTQISGTLTVDLPRPRLKDAEAHLAFHKVVEKLQSLLESS